MVIGSQRIAISFHTQHIRPRRILRRNTNLRVTQPTTGSMVNLSRHIDLLTIGRWYSYQRETWEMALLGIERR